MNMNTRIKKNLKITIISVVSFLCIIFIIIAITDILKNGSYLIFTENAKSVLESIYKLDDIKQGYYVDGLVSRKKQILPAILSELN